MYKALLAASLLLLWNPLQAEVTRESEYGASLAGAKYSPFAR